MTITQTESGKTTVINFSMSALNHIRVLMQNHVDYTVIEHFIDSFGIDDADSIVQILISRYHRGKLNNTYTIELIS